MIEESDALLRRGAEGVAPLTDDVMIWISQLVDQDVNIFSGAELSATNQRDLFASGLLPTRTPEDVYRAIVLDRLPNYISQDVIGSVPYMLAATPVRSGGRDSVLTVPLALRLQEVEREIDDLDRGVHLAALFFILLGAAHRALDGGAHRGSDAAADPRDRPHRPRRLRRAHRACGRRTSCAGWSTRSTAWRRSSRRSAIQLERTHRLEAWAEMARQVAHEIKNPLTPIQLSAEHLRRVHADRGEPLGPVLEGCVDSILGQVRLLRQIAAEFSSFASSPTARRRRPIRCSWCTTSSNRIAPASKDGSTPERGRRDRCRRCSSTARSSSRALANIVENALHAMPGSGRLRLTSGVEDGIVTIRVEDTGVGMDAEALERVFEPYFSTKTTGTGLGLPIARRNIELSGGTISVESEKGRRNGRHDPACRSTA